MEVDLAVLQRMIWGFFVSKVHGCQLLITIAKTSSILNIVLIVDSPLYLNILDNSLQVL